MSKKDFCFLIPVETVPRELDYKLLLSIKLANLGYTCYIGAKNEIWALFTYLKNYAYLDKGYHENFSVDNIYKKVIKNKGILFHLDEEGGVDFKGDPNIIRRYSNEVFMYAEKIFLWGNEQDKVLRKNKEYYNGDKIIISGHPRFQLLRAPNNSIYSTKVEKFRENYGKFILFNSNIKYANNINGVEFLYENYGPRIKNISDRIQYDKMKFNWNIELIESLAKNTSFKVIVRPHPEEYVNTYKKLFNSFPNVFVIYDKDIIPWILSCTYMLHNDCTTAVECAISGKMPLSYNKKPNMKFSANIPLAISRRFNNISSLLKYINSGKEESFNTSDSLLKERFSVHLDSIEVISTEMDKVVQQNRIENNRKSLIGISKYKITSFVKIILYPVSKMMLYNKDKAALNKISKLDNKTFVFNEFNKFSLVESGKSIKIKRVRPKLYLVCS